MFWEGLHLTTKKPLTLYFTMGRDGIGTRWSRIMSVIWSIPSLIFQVEKAGAMWEWGKLRWGRQSHKGILIFVTPNKIHQHWWEKVTWETGMEALIDQGEQCPPNFFFFNILVYIYALILVILFYKIIF